MGESNSHSTVNCHELLPLPVSADDIFKLQNFNHMKWGNCPNMLAWNNWAAHKMKRKRRWELVWLRFSLEPKVRVRKWFFGASAKKKEHEKRLKRFLVFSFSISFLKLRRKNLVIGSMSLWLLRRAVKKSKRHSCQRNYWQRSHVSLINQKTMKSVTYRSSCTNTVTMTVTKSVVRNSQKVYFSFKDGCIPRSAQAMGSRG